MAERIGVESREKRNAGANPRWWVLLAVVLALMALVTAASARSGRPRLSASRPARPAAAPEPARLPLVAPTSAVPALPESGAQAGPSAAPAETASDVGAAAPVIAATPTPAPAFPAPTVTPTSAVPTPAPQAPLTSTTSTTTPTAGTTFPGYLQSPDNVSAQYQTTATGPLTATATWSGGATLTLSASCPGGQRALTGPSGVTVSIVDPSGSSAAAPVSCTVTLSEPSDEATTVSYTLTVDHGA